MLAILYFKEETLGIKPTENPQDNITLPKIDTMGFSKTMWMYKLNFPDVPLSVIKNFLKRTGLKPDKMEIREHTAVLANDTVESCGEYKYGDSTGTVDCYHAVDSSAIVWKIILWGVNPQSMYNLYKKDKNRLKELEKHGVRTEVYRG